MMGRFMAEDKGDLVLIAGIGNECKCEADDWPALLVAGLKGVRRLVRAIVNHDLEVTVDAGIAAAAFALGDRLDPAHDSDEVLCGDRG